MDSHSVEISVVSPVYCEGTSITSFVEELHRVLAATASSFEITLVDDGSTDNSWQAISQLANHSPEISGLRLSRNFGKEYAVSAGIEHARGRAVIVMDCDFQHPPQAVRALIEHWRAGKVDIVAYHRRDRGAESTGRRYGSWLFYEVLRRTARLDLEGATDFQLLDRKVVESWKQLGERTLFFRGMVAWLGFRRLELPLDTPDRMTGISKWSYAKLLRLALGALTSFTSAPLVLVTWAGILLSGFAFVLGIQTLYMKYFGGAVDGFTTVILCILIVGGVLSCALGIIGEYLARIYDEVKCRPRYLIAETVGNRPAQNQ